MYLILSGHCDEIHHFANKKPHSCMSTFMALVSPRATRYIMNTLRWNASRVAGNRWLASGKHPMDSRRFLSIDPWENE